METLIVFVIGVVSGLIAGILPGIGGVVIMTLAFPMLIQIDPVDILIFYVTMASVDQYFNGITAIVFGVPGASMNIPTQLEGHTLFRRGRGDQAIMNSAIGSYFASMFAVLIVVLMLPVLWSVYGIWTSLMQGILLSVAAVVLVIISRNNFLLNSVLFAVGGIIGQVGYSEERGGSFLTFGMDALYSGIPTMSVLVSLFVIPVLLKSYSKMPGRFEFPGITIKGYKESLMGMRQFIHTLTRSSFLGSIGGLMPGMSFGFSSLLAYVAEKGLRKKKKVYAQGDMHSLVACESANNAGVFTQLVPLLFLGIPITASEALIYNILETRGLPVDIGWFKTTFSQVLMFFILSSTLGLILSSRYINFLKFFNGTPIQKIYIAVVFMLLVALWQTGVSAYAGVDHLVIALCLMPVGILMYKLDTTPLLFGYLLSEPLLDNIKRIFVIYF